MRRRPEKGASLLSRPQAKLLKKTGVYDTFLDAFSKAWENYAWNIMLSNTKTYARKTKEK
jgi:hypothetical protein